MIVLQALCRELAKLALSQDLQDVALLQQPPLGDLGLEALLLLDLPTLVALAQESQQLLPSQQAGQGEGQGWIGLQLQLDVVELCSQGVLADVGQAGLRLLLGAGALLGRHDCWRGSKGAGHWLLGTGLSQMA